MPQDHSAKTKVNSNINVTPLVDVVLVLLIIFMIVVQVTSVAGAYLFAVIGEKFGYKRSLISSVVMMIAVKKVVCPNQKRKDAVAVNLLNEKNY